MPLRSRLAALAAAAIRTPAAQRAARDLARSARRAVSARRTDSARRAGPARRAASAPHHALTDRPSAPALHLAYAPVDDDRPDPGEVVWSWVPFEEDLTRGKDRPVLVLAREEADIGGSDGSGQVLVCLMLTSHDRGRGTHIDERGATWVDIGSGAWDARRRPSEARVDRLLRIPMGAVRREGTGLDRRRYDLVAAAVRTAHGWDA